MMGSELISFLEVINSCISGNYSNKYSEAKIYVTNVRGYFEVERTKTDLGKCEWIEFVCNSSRLSATKSIA
jgi:hypothetical protein